MSDDLRALSVGEAALVRGDLAGAEAAFAQILAATPAHDGALTDLALVRVQQERLGEAAALFRQALGANPSSEAAFFGLLDTVYDAEGAEAARTAFQAFEGGISQSEEKQRYRDGLGIAPEPGRLRILFVCGPDVKFINEIKREIGRRHEVRTLHFERSVDLAAVQRGMDWADVTWFEWCDPVLVHASQKLRKTSRVACRLHSYEAFTSYPQQVNWAFVDHVVFVAPHIEEVFQGRTSAPVATSVIPNGVDLSKLAYKERRRGFNLAYLGYLNFKKNPELLLQCMADLVARDDRYQLHIAGSFQEPRHELYFEKMIPAMGLEGRVHLHGWVDDVDAWLEDKHYLVSTSVLESFGMGIAEAMAKGLKPIIHNWVGAEHVFPDHLRFNTVREFSDLVLEEAYDPASYRTWIEERYALPDRAADVEALLQRLASQEEAADVRATPGTVRVRLPLDVHLEAPTGDHITGVLQRGEFYERAMLDFIRGAFPRGMRAVDVGAHIGNHAVFLAATGAAAEVDAFEPNPSSFALLKANVERNVPGRVRVHRAAVGAASGRGRLLPGPANNSGMTMVEADEKGAVDVVALDDVIARPVDLLKVDVEGAAADVLRGARKLIERDRPALFVECADQGEFDAVAAEVTPLGYRPVRRFNHTPTILFVHAGCAGDLAVAGADDKRRFRVAGIT